MTIRLRIDRGAELSDSAVDEMWALRDRALPLEASTDGAAEAARSITIVRRATHVARGYDDTGMLVAMGTIRRSACEVASVGTVSELETAHVVTERAVRGGLSLLWSAWRSMVCIGWLPEGGACAPRLGVPPLITGVAYPAAS